MGERQESPAIRSSTDRPEGFLTLAKNARVRNDIWMDGQREEDVINGIYYVEDFNGSILGIPHFVRNDIF
jgi:hypothetical protein